jgi:hypothetical protein
MTRSLRHIAAWSALVAVLFAQVCLAAYACPLDLPAEVSAAVMSPDCHGVTAASPDAACNTHCQAPSASASAVQPPLPAILDAAPLIVAMPDACAAATRSAPGDDVIPTATAPPAAIRFCRFLN